MQKNWKNKIQPDKFLKAFTSQGVIYVPLSEEMFAIRRPKGKPEPEVYEVTEVSGIGTKTQQGWNVIESR